ncbi:MAG TPA: S41 family peptidase [Gaiellaceae bacterium]|nr:S41 family peptidase [Gaiellaceae bacterium]
MPGLLLAVLLAMVVGAGSVQASPSAPSTAAEDVRELGKSIEQIHPAAFRSVSKQRFSAEVNALAQRAPSLERDELLVGMLRIVALLGPRNGHTGLFPGDPAHTSTLHLYPLRLYHFADGMYVVDAIDRSLVGRKLVAIDGVTVERVLELVEPLVPRDNSSNLRGLAPHYLLTAEVLDGLGVVDDGGPADFTLEAPGGSRADVALTRVVASRYTSRFADPLFGHYPSILPAAQRPLYLSASARPLWATTLANGRAVYVGYNSVRSPTPAILRKLDRLVKSPKVRRVIVDVRLNGGGDNTTYGSLTTLFGSSAVNKRGKLYLLVGRATFSAAGNFSAEIDRATKAVIVGEPTGGGVETYGDTFPVLLPSVGWTVRIAARYHERKKSRSDSRLAVDPDVRVDLTSAQYFSGRDPVLDRALRGL